ncbi:DUF485 domain-containing protein [Streptomyces sp. NPDC050549]|uniref:DUF485 domain-containing protein n=1 Tax=Streptomyces sp. NPDC050549 TaxID=3155406 RepID=UPI0034217B5C
MSADSSELHPLRHRPARHASPIPPSPPPAAHSNSNWRSARARSWTGPHRDLRLLRRACRRQRRVAALAALGYFAVFLTLTVALPSVMTAPALGGLPAGLCLALVQLPVTWLAVLFYEYTARRHVDPLARRVRHQTPHHRDEQVLS